MNELSEHLLRQMPPAQGTMAAQVDWLYYFIFWLSLVMFAGIVGPMLYFVWKYRAKPGEPAKVGLRVGHHDKLEIFWTFAPLVLLVYLFHAGFKQYVAEAVPPPNAMEFRVKASQWGWDFVYPGGTVVTGDLLVPEDTPVRLVMSSEDVLHAFFIPGFRLKKDVVPGMFSTLWFQPTPLEESEHLADANGQPSEQAGRDVQVFCAEYCGQGHSVMLAKIHVVPRRDYQRMLDDLDRPPPGQTAAQWGASLFLASGCTACHSVEAGVHSNCPNLRGVVGHPVDLEGGGSVAEADLDYVRESILQPQAKIVRGYANVQMRTFQLSDARIQAIYAYLQAQQ